MPGMQICSRKFQFGTDDLVYPMMFKCFQRMIWVIIVSIFLCNQWNDFQNCKHLLLTIFFFSIIIFMVTSIFMNLLIMSQSMRGSITDPFNKRKWVSSLIIVRLIYLIIELSWYLVGTIWIHMLDTTHCSDKLQWNCLIVIYTMWVIIGFYFLAFIISFGCFSISKNEKIHNFERQCSAGCLHILCGFRQEHKKAAFKEVSNFLSEYFKDVDLVPTDIMSGLILLHIKQKLAPLRPAKFEVIAKPQPWMKIQLALHYVYFALGCYGWMFYIYDKPYCGVCHILSKNNCCCCCIKTKDHPIFNENCCQCNIAAILTQTNINIEDIIYANFTNEIYETPFYVAVDKIEHSIVVAIRGTLSIYDVITDLTIESHQFHNENISDGYVHKGIYNAANFVKSTLIDNRILDDALEKMPNYKIVIIGHSLGAGTAALVAIMLKPKYPNLICFAYAPPGWILNRPMLRHSEDFILSVVVGKDMIPRAGVKTMDKLKFDLLQVIKKSNVPKYKILMGGVMKKLCGYSLKSLNENFTSFYNNHSDHLIDDPNYQPTHSYTEEEIPIQSTIYNSLNENKVLFMPGQVMYISRESKPNQHEYFETWSRAENFDEICVSGKMICDHVPDRFRIGLESAAKRSSTTC